MQRRLKKVAVGGTFDEFHKGHRALLSAAFKAGERVLIGLCTDDFVEKMSKPHKVAPFAVRLEELKGFLGKQGWLARADIVPLFDAYGPSVTDECLAALVVSEETEQVAHSINAKRRERNLDPLIIITVNMVLAENCNPISTTRIRRLEIDREGRLLK